MLKSFKRFEHCSSLYQGKKACWH